MFELYPWRDSGRLYGAASCISVFIAIGLGLFLLRLVRRVFLQVSLEDRAQMDYGKAFDRLTGIQRDRVKWARGREWKDGDSRADERDAALQRDAEGRAFRMLKWGLPVTVAVYWAVCLSVPIGPVRVGLLISAVAISGLVIVVLALPEVIRVWAMPDETTEPQIVV
jgi:hypothetical protein